MQASRCEITVAPKGAVSISEQNGDRGARKIRSDNVWMVIVVEICNGDGIWRRTGGIVDRRLEGSVAIAELNYNRCQTIVDDCKIGLAVTIQISGRNADRIRKCPFYHVPRHECTVAVAEQDRRKAADVAIEVGGGGIESAVPVEVGKRHGKRRPGGAILLQRLKCTVAVP